MAVLFRFRAWRAQRVLKWVMLYVPGVVIGCVSIEQLAPPVDEVLVGVSAGYGVDTETLARGRRVYLNSCIKCHSLEPLTRYEPVRWDVIVKEMAVEANLTGGQTADLRQYLAVSRKVVEQREAQGE